MQLKQIAFPGMRSNQQFEENGEIFDFSLSEEDMKKIFSLNKNARFYDRIQDENFSFIPYWA
jgi:diketogulonate reductase-like aldo/keto reductase